jgi:hypothetical protein
MSSSSFIQVQFNETYQYRSRKGEKMNSIKKIARVAGFLYLILIVSSSFAELVRSSLIVPGDAATTANKIAANELLFRLGIVGDLLTGTIAIFLVLALYRLFKGVDQNHAALMVVLGGLMVTPIFFLNTLNDVAVLVLARGDFLSVFDRSQLDAMASLFLHLHHHGILVNEIFWGLWLFPFGVLVFRSGFVPRILGVWLIINGFAYLTLSFTGLLLPHYEDMVSRIAFPALVGELATVLWLLIMGAKVQTVNAQLLDRLQPRPG